MGTKVLSITLGNRIWVNGDVTLCKCSSTTGKIAVLFVNIDEEKSFKTNLDHVKML